MSFKKEGFTHIFGSRKPKPWRWLDGQHKLERHDHHQRREYEYQHRQIFPFLTKEVVLAICIAKLLVQFDPKDVRLLAKDHVHACSRQRRWRFSMKIKSIDLEMTQEKKVKVKRKLNVTHMQLPYIIPTKSNFADTYKRSIFFPFICLVPDC